jgi:hypothetical protein
LTDRVLHQNFSDQGIGDFTKSQRLAGAFALNAIYHYLNDVVACAGADIPERVGGKAYIYFNTAYREITAVYTPDMDDRGRQKWACLGAVEAVRLFVDGYTQSDDVAMVQAYDRFSMKINVIDRLLDGESLQDVAADLQAYPNLIEGDISL